MSNQKTVLIVGPCPVGLEDLIYGLFRPDFIGVVFTTDEATAGTIMESLHPDAMIVNANVQGSLDGPQVAKRLIQKHDRPRIVIGTYCHPDQAAAWHGTEVNGTFSREKDKGSDIFCFNLKRQLTEDTAVASS